MKTWMPVLMMMTTVLPACSGDDETVITPDAAITADSAPTPDADQTDAGPPGCECAVVGVDYANGVGTTATIKLPELTVTKNVVPGSASGDPVLRFLDGKLYVVNRFGFNSVTVIDPAGPTFVRQFFVGANVNPQDIAVAGSEAWIVGLGTKEVRVIDMEDLAAAPIHIPLPTVASDADMNPDPSSIVIAGGKAYVTLEHLESFFPASIGQVVVIDVATHVVDATFDLISNNPTNFMRAGQGGALFVGTTPDFTPTTGCLEKITTSGAPAATCLASAVALGGFVASVAPADDGSIFVATGQSFTEGQVKRVSAAGVVEAGSYTSAGQQPTDIAVCGNFLVASDAAVGGVRVYDIAAKTELTTTALDVGLPPAFASGIACYQVP